MLLGEALPAFGREEAVWRACMWLYMPVCLGRAGGTCLCIMKRREKMLCEERRRKEEGEVCLGGREKMCLT
jgi:hypothetical protein